jgi:hypothetical protein
MAYSRGSSGRSPSVALVTRIPHSHLGEMVEVDEEVEVDPRESSGRATIRHGVTAAAARATTVAANAINGDAVSKAVTVKYSASIPGGRPAPASPG